MLKRPNLPESRVDLVMIAGMVPQGARVLDVGCGDGTLLDLLRAEKDVDGRGIDVSRENVNACVARGLSVIQGDADFDLAGYPDEAFDLVILSDTIQATRKPREVLEHLLRIGKRVVISFPNFAHWRIRWQILVWGRMPVTETIGYEWYDTPNIHLCTIKDFVALVETVGATVERALPLDRDGHPMHESLPFGVSNLLAPQALFVLRRG